MAKTNQNPTPATPATPAAPLGLGNSMVNEYEVVSINFLPDHVVVKLQRDQTLSPGDPGFVGTPSVLRIGAADPAEVSEFQMGKRVRLTLEVI